MSRPGRFLLPVAAVGTVLAIAVLALFALSVRDATVSLNRAQVLTEVPDELQKQLILGGFLLNSAVHEGRVADGSEALRRLAEARRLCFAMVRGGPTPYGVMPRLESRRGVSALTKTCADVQDLRDLTRTILAGRERDAGARDEAPHEDGAHDAIPHDEAAHRTHLALLRRLVADIERGERFLDQEVTELKQAHITRSAALMVILGALFAGGIWAIRRSSRTILEQSETLAYRVVHDPVTGLGNRSSFHADLERAVERSDRDGTPLSVMVLDLDGFKSINETLGHAAGDRVLAEVGLRVRRAAGVETVARLGADEFAVLLPGADDGDARAVTANVMSAVRSPVRVEESKVVPLASAGIAVRSPGEPAEAVLRNADAALEAAKASRGTYEVFTQEMHQQIIDRLTTVADLRGAIDRGEISVYYQPIVGADTSAVVKLEALVRWRHPERGFVSPAEFIPLAEETGLILPLGHFVLETACRQLSDWRRQGIGPPDLAVSVNLSARQLREPTLRDDVERILDATALPASSLDLEITETAAMGDLDLAVTQIRALRGLGVRVVLDDFGTGYSSLTYLQRLPVEAIKIDRSFVAGVVGVSNAWLLALSIVKLIRALDLQVIAEGVEDAAQVAHLRALGCDLLQGYYFGRPEDGAAATERLRSSRPGESPPGPPAGARSLEAAVLDAVPPEGDGAGRQPDNRASGLGAQDVAAESGPDETRGSG